MWFEVFLQGDSLPAWLAFGAPADCSSLAHQYDRGLLLPGGCHHGVLPLSSSPHKCCQDVQRGGLAWRQSPGLVPLEVQGLCGTLGSPCQWVNQGFDLVEGLWLHPQHFWGESPPRTDPGEQPPGASELQLPSLLSPCRPGALMCSRCPWSSTMTCPPTGRTTSTGQWAGCGGRGRVPLLP